MAGGFVGLLDFAGYPVAGGVHVPRGGGFQGAGRYHNLLRAMAFAEHERSLLDEMKIADLLRERDRLKLQRSFEQVLEEQKRLAGLAAYSVVLTEL
jgi:hypothetical protein